MIYSSVERQERDARQLVGSVLLIAVGVALVIIGGSAAVSVHHADPLPPVCVSQMVPGVEYSATELCPEATTK